MGLIDQAVRDGVRDGYEKAFYARCSGKDDPEERCPMRPKDGCNCLWMRWRELPWYLRAIRRQPPRCGEDEMVKAMIDDAVSHALAPAPLVGDVARGGEG